METLFVGLDSGATYQLYIPKEYNHMRYQEVSDLKHHEIALEWNTQNTYQESDGIARR